MTRFLAIQFVDGSMNAGAVDVYSFPSCLLFFGQSAGLPFLRLLILLRFVVGVLRRGRLWRCIFGDVCVVCYHMYIYIIRTSLVLLDGLQ